MLQHRPTALIPNPGIEGGDPMSEPTQFDPGRIRVVLDHGEVVELDGGTLVLDGEESPSVVLRLTPWRARSMARMLQEWSSVSQIFRHPTRPPLSELDLSRTLELAAAVLGTTESRSYGLRVDHAGFPIGNAWPPWQSWASARRSYPQCSALPWSMPPHGGSRSPTAASNSPTLCWRRAVRRRLQRSTSTSP